MTDMNTRFTKKKKHMGNSGKNKQTKEKRQKESWHHYRIQTYSVAAAEERTCPFVIVLVFAQPSCKHADSQAGVG